ncbi:MAG TPA: amino acid ABC transporter substrate-binding protein [Xanthobacteraceae bacterium]|nr:amino acid ABC transporter substrate-binding protein [Xanthobacteraceae bacterium]
MSVSCGLGMVLRAAALGCALIASVTAVSAQTPPPADSRLKSIVANKVIRIAYRADDRPFAFVNDAKEPLGYTIDLCKQVTASIAQQYKITDLKIEWVPVTVETRFSAVAGNKADMECGSSTVTLGRMREVDFSILVFVESTGVLVTRQSNVQKFTELVGKKLAVVGGTSNERAVTDLMHALNLNITLVTVKNRDEAMAALESGKADGFASDKLLLAGAKIQHPEALLMLPDDLSIEQTAIVLPRGDWAFRLAVNTGLAQIFRSGRMKDVFERWFFGATPGVLLQSVYALGRIAN